MMFAPTTLVISRRSDTERRARFRAQADAIGLEAWAFFDAIDGVEMRLSTATPSRHGRAGRPAPTPLWPGEIGCALSHLAIVRSCLALGIGSACVMEDDVEFVDPDIFPSAWNVFVRACPADWLMVHAGGDDFYAETAPLPISEHVARVRLTYGTRFMVMKTEAMQLLSDAGAAMEEPADWLLEPLFATGRVYYPRRALMRHSDGPSGIQPEEV